MKLHSLFRPKCLFFAAFSFVAVHSVLASKPNIILILVDDMDLGDVSGYGTGGSIKTPNLDKLASEGRRFLDAHTPSGVCTPTRYGLLTCRNVASAKRGWMSSKR